MAEVQGQQRAQEQQGQQTQTAQPATKEKQQQSGEMTKTPSARERYPRRGFEPYRGSGEVMRPELTTSPFSMIGRLMTDMSRLFDDFGLGGAFASPVTRDEAELAPTPWIPKMDVFKRDGNLVVHADLPGLRQEDVNVNIEDDILTISGERSHEHEHERGGVYRCERSYGSFERRIALPEGVDPEKVDASFENGVLEVSIPMPEEQMRKGRVVPIRSASAGPETKH